MTWFKIFGTAAAVAAVDANVPFDGWEKIGSMGLLGICMWFILTRMENAIRENSSATRQSTEATTKLIDHLEKNN